MTGKPLPEVQWFKDDKPVVHRVLADGSLYIEKTDISDSGKYTVRVTNAAGQSEESMHVTVLQPSPPKGYKFLSINYSTINNTCCSDAKLELLCL